MSAGRGRFTSLLMTRPYPPGVSRKVCLAATLLPKKCWWVGKKSVADSGPGSLESHHACRVYGTRQSGNKKEKVCQFYCLRACSQSKEEEKRSKQRYQDLKWLLLDVNTRNDALHTQAGSSPKYIFHLNYTKLVTSQKLAKYTLLSKILTSLGRIWGWFLKPWHCQEGGMSWPMSWRQDLLVDKSPPKVII